MKKYTFLLSLLLILNACISPNQDAKTTPSKVDFALVHKVNIPKKITAQIPMLLLLHGLRSNEDDLISLANILDKRLLVVSARAPFDEGGNRYKWYDYQRVGAGKAKIDKVQAEQSRKLVIELIDQLVAAYGVDPKQVFVGGFSQGAMMSYSVGLSSPEKVKGIIAFSGKIPDEIQTVIADKSQLSDLSVFISHGKQDPVLSFKDALSDKQFLENLGIKTSFYEYNSKHTLSRQNIADFATWMGGVL